MLPYRDSRLVKIGLGIFFLIVLIYAGLEARGILSGPTITISDRALETSMSNVRIEGSAQRISTLTMNGKQIEVTEDGSFSVPFSLVPGYNRIVLDAIDKYGKKAQRTIEIVYDPSKRPGGAGGSLEASTTAPR